MSSHGEPAVPIEQEYGMKRKIASLLAGSALLAGLGLTVPAAHAAPATQHIAAAITSRVCGPLNIPDLTNPVTGAADPKLFVRMSWKVALTASGRPEASFNTGSSIFVENNRTDGYKPFWSDGIWYDGLYDGNVGSNWWGWGHAATGDTRSQIPNGGNKGWTIGSDGRISSSTSGGYENIVGGLGSPYFLKLIENYGASTPELSITLRDMSNPSGLYEQSRIIFNPGRDSQGNVTCGAAPNVIN